MASWTGMFLMQKDHVRSMVTRTVETFREDLRKEISKDLFTDSRLMDNTLIRNFVDDDALNKCRLSTYGQMRRLTNDMVSKTEDEEDIERARRKVGNYSQLQNLSLGDNIEQIYFETYGESFDGSPVVDPPKDSYTCVCGTRMMMPSMALPDECPRCRRLTPLGRLKADGVLRR